MSTRARSGILDFPRQKLPESLWVYDAAEPFPRLKPELRSLILREARHRLSKFGAKLTGAMLYGGAAGYQYHEGADIDVSLYIDWKDFQGDEAIMEEAFKSVEIPYGGFRLHLFVKPASQPEQVEVADAYYDVLHDEWKLPPLILPKDFDPEIYFKGFLEQAEKKAEAIDLLMGRVAREWGKLKSALQARKEDPRDPEVVKARIELQKKVLLDLTGELVRQFVEIWTGRRKMHDELRKRFVMERNIGKYERFQPAEVTWKLLDQAGYVEFLKVLAKAHESGVLKNLLDQV
jgi:hypothetical protein